MLLQTSDAPDQPMILKAHKDNVRTLAFNSDSTLLASGSEDQTIRIWDLEEISNNIKAGKKEISNSKQLLHGHKYGVCSVAFDPKDPQRLVSCSWDRTIRFWYLEGHIDAEPKSFIDFPKNPKNKEKMEKLDAIATSFINKNEVIIGYRNGTIIIRDISKPSNSEPKLLVSGSEDVDIYAIAFDIKYNNLQKIAISGEYKNTHKLINKLWDAENNKNHNINTTVHLDELSEILVNFLVKSLSFNSNGTKLALTGHDPSSDEKWDLQVWDVTNSEPHLIKPFKKVKPEEFQWKVTTVAFSPREENLLAVAGNVDDKDEVDIRLWNITTEQPPDPSGTHKKRYGGKAPVILVFSPDGKQLASGSDSDDITLWKVDLDKEPQLTEITHLPKPPEDPQKLPTYNFWITSLAFNNHHHKQLASGRYDGSIQVWDLDSDHWKDENYKPKILKHHEERVNALTFSKDG